MLIRVLENCIWDVSYIKVYELHVKLFTFLLVYLFLFILLNLFLFRFVSFVFFLVLCVI